MQYFTRSTIIEPLMKIRRERMLPAGGDVVARIGQEVSPMQVVARMPRKLDFHILPISETLRISPKELHKSLLVKEGEDVDVGTPLIEKRGLFGKPFLSPVDGQVFKIGSGRIVLQRTAGWIELRAMLRGRIVNQIPNRGVVIETNGSLLEAIWSSGVDGHGKLKVIAETAAEPLQVQQLGEDTSEHVLVTGAITQLDSLKKAARNNVSGLIAGSISSDLRAVAETFQFPIIITDGIGTQGMAKPIFQLLQESDACDASLFCKVQSDFHSRPAIIIPKSEKPKIETPRAHESIKVGRIVRILRPPYSSQAGEVVRLYTMSKTTAIGTRAHGADVKLEDGHVIFVPFANLDLMM